ncbi:hypothetical protein [Phaeobacter inhibens]|uniref:hypothetical protein n=1 Tax=Phaeobacter inhibens TaxID=221822 RepID=UPI0001632BCB|nr:hypothetical protein [Phaeobacter inhibens]AFO91534.1 hypothetical protein PGA1_c18370 [Phaeobacter inhibens DSM 17395]AUQ46201.1 hypothetical protein PhaeoP10_01863 [Phaeobacter inhibens]
MLPFEIDESELRRIADEFDADKDVLRASFSRALKRTAQAIKTRARKELRTELELRNAAEIRKRLHGFRYKRGAYDLGEVRMWFGLNDMRVSAFKGRASRTASGARFAGQDFPGAFVGRNRKGKQTIMRRAGHRAWPIKEEVMPVNDKAQTYIEDQVLDDFEEVFFKVFRAEVRARTLYGIGKG